VDRSRFLNHAYRLVIGNVVFKTGSTAEQLKVSIHPSLTDRRVFYGPPAFFHQGLFNLHFLGITVMNSFKVQGFNYRGYEEIAEKYCLSAAVSVTLIGTRLIATSGHVGLDENGQIGQSLKEEMEVAFKVCAFASMCSFADLNV
jgi:hypothetical protein